jgi:YHS domain-containing protein
MVKDPVCGMEVDERQAKETAEHQGKTTYFCAPGCRVAFEKTRTSISVPRMASTNITTDGLV